MFFFFSILSYIFSNLKQTGTQDSSYHTVAFLAYSFFLFFSSKDISFSFKFRTFTWWKEMVLGVRRPVFCLLICYFSCVSKQVILRRECQTSLSALCGLRPAVFSGSCFCYIQVSRFQCSPDQSFSQPLFMCFLDRPASQSSGLKSIKDLRLMDIHFLLLCFHAFLSWIEQ